MLYHIVQDSLVLQPYTAGCMPYIIILYVNNKSIRLYHQSRLQRVAAIRHAKKLL